MCGALIMFKFALTRGQQKKSKVTKRFEALEGGREVGGQELGREETRFFIGAVTILADLKNIIAIHLFRDEPL